MEIERKFLVKKIPDHPEDFPCRQIEQGYLNIEPVVRVRKDADCYYLTYKGKGFMVREESNLPLTKEAYEHLLSKADGNIISKKRYLIPIAGTSLTAELDIFAEPFVPLVIVEVEFEDTLDANAFVIPEWFGEEVTNCPEFTNSSLSRRTFENESSVQE